MTPRAAEMLLYQSGGGVLVPASFRQTPAQAQNSTSGAIIVTLTTVPSIGDWISVPVFITSFTGTVSLSGLGVPATGTGAWTKTVDSAPSGALMQTWTGEVTTTPSNGTLTCTPSAGYAFAQVYVFDVEGSSGVDTQNTSTATSTTPTIPSMTLASAGEAVTTQTWIQGGAVSAVNDHGFTDSYNPIGQGPGNFQSWIALGSANSYTAETYTAPSGAWYSQAVAFKSASGGGSGGGGGGGGSGTMSAPSYSGSTWTSGNKTFEDQFTIVPGAAGSSWNFGITDNNASGSGGGYTPWAASGSSPNWGSSETGSSNTGNLDYDFPGNVFQTTHGADSSLFGTYTPQTFDSSGSGLSIQGHYQGHYTVNDVYGTQSFSWSSGAINTYNHVSFPVSPHTDCYVQINAQMMGYNGSNNGTWNALWFLGQGNGSREIDLQETGIAGQSPNYLCSHLQSPQVDIENYLASSDLSAGYHIYGMEIIGSTNTVNIYLDNVLRGTASLGSGNGPYFLIMNGSIASGTFSASPSTNVDMVMNVAEVQVYQR